MKIPLGRIGQPSSLRKSYPFRIKISVGTFELRPMLQTLKALAVTVAI